MTGLQPKHLPLFSPPPPPAPSRVALISLTTFCNARCEFCCVLDILNRPELNPTDEKLFATIKEARESGCTTLAFTGGEPTLHPRFAEFCRYGRELGYESITINTNGIKFKSREWTREVLEAGLSNIDFSIHGHTAELHDEMVARPGAFAAIEKGMKHLLELGPKSGAVLGATCVVTASNARHLGEIARVLIELGFQSLRFKHCFEGGTGADAELVGRYQELMPAVKQAVELCHRRRVGIQLTHFPLCLLEEEVVYATDLTDENVLSIDRDGSILSDGRASQHRREDGGPCGTCLVADTCAKLDQKYIAAFGETEVRPFGKPEALTELFARGVDRYEVGEAKRRALDERLLSHGAPSLPPQVEAPRHDGHNDQGGHVAGRPGRQTTTSVSLGEACRLSCGALCDCKSAPSETDERGVPLSMQGGGAQLIIRGEGAEAERLPSVLAAAVRDGWGERWVRATGQLHPNLEAALRLREQGATGAIVPLFSHAPAVHDRIAGKAGALATAFGALHAFADAGLHVSIEIPLLSPKLQDLSAMIRLAQQKAGSLHAVRLYVPRRRQQPLLSPPRWSQARAGLERAFAVCRDLGIQATIGAHDGIPHCAVPPSWRDLLPPTSERQGTTARSGYAQVPVCQGCALRARCLGPTESYVAAHGELDLVAAPLEGDEAPAAAPHT